MAPHGEPPFAEVSGHLPLYRSRSGCCQGDFVSPTQPLGTERELGMAGSCSSDGDVHDHIQLYIYIQTYTYIIICIHCTQYPTPKIKDGNVICHYFVEDFTFSISLGGSLMFSRFGIQVIGDFKWGSRKHSNGFSCNLCVEFGGVQLPCLIPKLDVVNISCIICSGSILKM